MHTHTHSQDSGDESGTMMTFTEEDDMDEMNVIDYLEDEEQLIVNSGVSIPVSSHISTHFQATPGWRSTPPVTSHIPSTC